MHFVEYDNSLKAWKKLAKTIRFDLDQTHVNELRDIARILKKLEKKTKYTKASAVMIDTITRKFTKLSKHTVKKTLINASPLAKAMKRPANREVKESFSWEKPEMTGMLLDDAADHLQIGIYIKNKKTGLAQNLAADLDTASRDEIPLKVWKYLFNDY